MAHEPSTNGPINSGGASIKAPAAVLAAITESRSRSGRDKRDFRRRAIEMDEATEQQTRAMSRAQPAEQDPGTMLPLMPAGEEDDPGSGPAIAPPPAASQPPRPARPLGPPVLAGPPVDEDGLASLLPAPGLAMRPPPPYRYNPRLRPVAVDLSTVEACKSIPGTSRLTCALVLAQIVYVLDPDNRQTLKRPVETEGGRRWTVLPVQSWGRIMCLGRMTVSRTLDSLRQAGLIDVRTEGGSGRRCKVTTELRLPGRGADGRGPRDVWVVRGWVRDVVQQALPRAKSHPLAFFLLARLEYWTTRPRRGKQTPRAIRRQALGESWLCFSVRKLARRYGVTAERIRLVLEDLRQAGLIDRVTARKTGHNPETWVRLTFDPPHR